MKAAVSGATALFLVAAHYAKTDPVVCYALAFMAMVMLTAAFVLGRKSSIGHVAHDVEKPDLEKPLVEDVQDVTTNEGTVAVPSPQTMV